MSLYNALFGVNPSAGLVLQALGITADAVPRFRDAWITDDHKLAIHTRTGGGNRDMYEHEDSARRHYPEYFTDGDPPKGPWNADLRQLAGFRYDEDDDFDSTYATFYFDPSPEWKAIIETMQAGAGSPDSAAERWQKLFSDMQADGGPTTAEGKRALEIGKQIVGQISEALTHD